MVVIRTYTLYKEIIEEITKTPGNENQFAAQAEELRRGALAITEAVLYVKQHSVNCVSAAMYAMSRFDPRLFPPAEAERFASDLFREGKNFSREDGDEIREHILELYRRFLAEGEKSEDWKKPLLDFLREH
jgi:hypothetical protein